MIENPKEVWKDIPNYEGLYQVSNLGRVRSVPRKVRRLNRWGKEDQVTVPGRILAPGAHSEMGHLLVVLSKEGKKKSWRVHRLVLEAFVGPCPDGMEALHGDGNPANNRVENLRWGTSSENNLDIVRHGRHHEANKARCKQGHEFTKENTRFYGPQNRWRRCLTCEKESKKRYRRKRAE